MNATSSHDLVSGVPADAQRRALLDLIAQGPVHRVSMPYGGQLWMVTGHAEARAALTDTRLRRNSGTTAYADRLPDETRALFGFMLSLDPPDHTRLRRLVSSAFTRQRVESLEPRIEDLCARLIEPVAAALAGGQEVDLMASFALPLPFEVISDLVGIPAASRPALRDAYATLARGSFAPFEEFAAAARSMLSLLRDLIGQRRSEPGDDLLSALITAGDADERLTVDELTAMINLLLFAGHETTTGMIGNAMLALLRHPRQAAALRSGEVSMTDAVEEFLRFDGALRTTLPAEAAEPFRLGGADIAAGDRLVVLIQAVGLDPGMTERASELDLTRPGTHLAFGHGVHHCLGAPLARLELRIALTALLTRLPVLELGGQSEPVRLPALVFNRLQTLPVRAAAESAQVSEAVDGAGLLAGLPAGVQRAAVFDLMERGPVQRVSMPHGRQIWVVTGHAEAREALTDSRLRRAGGVVPYADRLPEEVLPLFGHMLNLDPPDHTRLRRLVSSTFSRRRVESLEARIDQLCREMLDPLAAALTDGQTVDLVAAFAIRMPFEVICELIGVPPASRAALRAAYGPLAKGSFAPFEEFAAAGRAMVALVHALIETRRREPGDDLLSALIVAGDDDERLTVDELTAMMYLLLIAGFETTAGMIGNAMLALLRHPSQMAALRSGAVSMTDAVEELLRYDDALRSTMPAEAAEPFRLGGADIAAGDKVVVLTQAVGLDPAMTERARDLDITRTGSHLAFGHGVHHCVGAPLARLELRVALTALLTRLPELEPAAESDPDRLPGLIFNGLEALPVRAAGGSAQTMPPLA